MFKLLTYFKDHTCQDPSIPGVYVLTLVIFVSLMMSEFNCTDLLWANNLKLLQNLSEIWTLKYFEVLRDSKTFEFILTYDIYDTFKCIRISSGTVYVYTSLGLSVVLLVFQKSVTTLGGLAASHMGQHRYACFL